MQHCKYCHKQQIVCLSLFYETVLRIKNNQAGIFLSQEKPIFVSRPEQYAFQRTSKKAQRDPFSPLVLSLHTYSLYYLYCYVVQLYERHHILFLLANVLPFFLQLKKPTDYTKVHIFEI
ncbi:hypothetical protein AD949_00135 [Acetobacter orleanensis]|nr:hypothetical protein AD949_00135 [Acetobacter orleanensis]PCD78374.1 hypothetical protein CO710_12520 [Acetobacter orleanensis]